MATNINQELFKRYAPKKKLEIINSLTETEIRATSMDTIARIIKEVGEKQTHSHFDKKTRMFIETPSNDKKLYIGGDRRAGNDWNSTVTMVEIYKKKLLVGVYFQMSDTDTQISVPYDEFFRSGEYHGKATEINRYGDSIPRYFTYEEKDKVSVIKSFLLEYVYTKYTDKL